LVHFQFSAPHINVDMKYFIKAVFSFLRHFQSM
jgi:hypothetical protein